MSSESNDSTRRPVVADQLYKVPLTLRRGTQWATRCIGCDKELRMGPGSKAAMLRLIGAVGRKCDDCRELDERVEIPDSALGFLSKEGDQHG